MSRPSHTRRRTVCLLSPHALVLGEFERLLSGSGFHVQGHRLESNLAPDLRKLPLPKVSVYVVDANLPRPATEALLAGILERVPGAHLVVVGERFMEANAFPLLLLGVKGLVNYGESRQQLPRALEAVALRGFWVPRSVLSRFVDSMLSTMRGRGQIRGPSDLSGREQQVLDALLENLSNKEIASKLNISERTVKFHVSNLLAKFGVQRRHDLILQCLQTRPEP